MEGVLAAGVDVAGLDDDYRRNEEAIGQRRHGRDDDDGYEEVVERVSI